MYIHRFNTQTLFFPLYGIRIPTQHSKLNCIHRNTITEFIPRHYNDRVTSKILTYIFFFPFFCFGGGGTNQDTLHRKFSIPPSPRIQDFIFNNMPL